MTVSTLPSYRVSLLAGILLCASGCASGARSVGPPLPPPLLSHKLTGVDDFGTLLVDAGLSSADLPRGEHLSQAQVRELQLRLELERPRPSEEAPWKVAQIVLSEALAQKKETVAKAALNERLRAFDQLYMMRRDGYFAHALSGKAVQSVGPVEVRNGALRAGAFEVEHFYRRDALQQWRAADTALAVAPAR